MYSLQVSLSRLLTVLGICALSAPAFAQPATPVPSAAASAATTLPKLVLEKIAEGFDKPVQIIVSPESSGQLYVVEQGGKVVSADEDKSKRETLVDLSEDIVPGPELGLLGAAFHPKYAENRKLFVHYVGKSRERENRLSELTVSPGGSFDERKLLRIPQPGEANAGGVLQFGPDDLLYIGIGDGGDGTNDPKNRGQNQHDQYGAILRIAVDADEATNQAYQAPVDNPYVANGLGHRDVYATGLRNPRTFVFDALTRSFWVGDAGVGLEQELDLVKAGGNYGWSVFDGTGCLSMRFECMNQKYVAPITAYMKDTGTSISVGPVYHGAALPPEYDGLLFYGDRGSGKLWALRFAGGSSKESSLVLETGLDVSAIGQDGRGEVVIGDYRTGILFRLSPAAGKPPAKPPILQKKAG